MENPIPKAFERLDAWMSARAHAGHMLIALDFDGTIAPIVSRPQEAYMLGSARAAIDRLLHRPDTDVAVVSGRALGDLIERCGISGVYYSGNHGLQIEGPDVHETREEALPLVPRIRSLAAELESALAKVPGVYVEDKELTLSVHSRMVDNEEVRKRVRSTVEAAFRTDPQGLLLTYGKRVVEIRPDINWHKGKALRFLIDAVSGARNSELFSIFIGDDRTDEDAFAVLDEGGAGIIVAAQPPADTAAVAWLASPEEVAQLLTAFAGQ